MLCDENTKNFRYFAISIFHHLLAVLLAGCTSAPPAPVRVEVPVMVPCIGAVPARPAYEFDKLPSTTTDGEIILALARDWLRGRGYEGELEKRLSRGVDSLLRQRPVDSRSRRFLIASRN